MFFLKNYGFQGGVTGHFQGVKWALRVEYDNCLTNVEPV